MTTLINIYLGIGVALYALITVMTAIEPPNISRDAWKNLDASIAKIGPTASAFKFLMLCLIWPILLVK